MNLKDHIATTNNFPKPGIVFRDITPILRSPEAFAFVVGEFEKAWKGKVDVVAALDARGFVFGAPLSCRLSVPLVLVRKKGKLPGKTESVSYGLEYGSDMLEVGAESMNPGSRVLIVDDLLATGGTALAAARLVEKVGAEVAGMAFVIRLEGLCDQKIQQYPVQALVSYRGDES